MDARVCCPMVSRNCRRSCDHHISGFCTAAVDPGHAAGAWDPVNPESIVPVMLCFDIEPDARALRGRTPEPLAGFEHLVKMVPELRDRLSEASGAPARFTWWVRIDPQIAEMYGSPVALVDRYELELDGVRDAGDALGVHPHTWRWQGRWVSERADAAWVAHCLAVGLGGYRDAFGVPCRVHKAGDEFITTAIAATGTRSRLDRRSSG